MENPEEKKKTHVDKMRENPWILSTIVLGIVVAAFVLSGTGFTGNITGGTIGVNNVGEKLLNFYESNGATGLTLDSVEEVSGVYKVNLEYQNTIVPIYVTKDGNYAGSMTFISYEESEIETEEEETTFTEEQNLLIQEFTSCLYEKGMRVYYAGWCGHCHNLIETFGGLDNAGEMMIECQTSSGASGEGAALCEQENITGFPTIKINGESYSSYRTFEAFAEATGCVAPEI